MHVFSISVKFDPNLIFDHRSKKKLPYEVAQQGPFTATVLFICFIMTIHAHEQISCVQLATGSNHVTGQTSVQPKVRWIEILLAKKISLAPFYCHYYHYYFYYYGIINIIIIIIIIIIAILILPYCYFYCYYYH